MAENQNNNKQNTTKKIWTAPFVQTIKPRTGQKNDKLIFFLFLSITDDRFVMKQMSGQELQCFLEFVPHYFRYVNQALNEQERYHVTG